MSFIRDFINDKHKVVIFIVLIALAIFSPYVLKPQIAGDSLLYTGSIQVLETGIRPSGFLPMMIITTYLGLVLIIFLNLFTHSIAASWLILDGILYVTSGLFFYSLLKRFFSDSRISFIGTLFLMINYAAITFGLGYLMDMGGWAAYIASVYFSYRYLEDGQTKWLYISALLIGLGGIYKEYAFVSYAVLFGVIIWSDWKNWKQIFWKVIVTGILSFLPFIILNIYSYISYNHYTYLDWVHHQKVYSYQNRVVEFIKSFGSIYNFGWFLFFPGLYLLLKRYQEMFKNKDIFFIFLLLLSCLSVLAWPVVTRVLFITMPAAVIVSVYFMSKFKKYNYLFILLLLVYVLSAYLMDAFILNFVNLPF